MDSKILEQLHNVHLEMIDEVDRICNKYGLSYWLDSGSALGAIRHNGFIPWDDDIDIGMLREDYDKFIAVAKIEMSSAYVIQDKSVEPEYNNFHIKIRKLNTVFPQSYNSKYKYRGIQLDIFPFDYVPDDSKKTIKKCRKLQKYREFCNVATRGVLSQNLIKRITQRIIKIVPAETYRNYFERSCQKYNNKPTEYLTSHTYRMQREKVRIFKTEDLIPTKRVKFEDREYSIMNNPDAYLKSMYGDYMALPPEDKRVCHLTGEIIFDTSIENKTMHQDIVFTEKPDSVSWDSIHEVLWEAHESTRKIGISYPSSEMTGSELNEFINKHNGKCFVAMDADKVVGTMSCYVENVSTRLFKGKFLMIALVGNIPAYKGKQIFSRLYDRCYDYAKSNGLDGLTFGTAERNHTMRKIFEKKGFLPCRCYYNKEKKRFVVGGVYCFKKLPHKKWYYVLVFKLKQVVAHLKSR